ncbi:MFS transporter [Stakelama sp. CBK3Z-3]|uniref:MFS transporter n=1 Tax=Stakelama flava TaxID=2860338 RepID=A0ABS6XLN5_9SPHN|nr:MFS transporter [Stakelama flava]MBW4331124.1 MFS transporter [Stakelama flava]
MSRSTLFIASGFGLVATCYGLARFAFGLFLPAIASDLALTASFSGLVSGGSFLGYCIAIIASAVLTERFGPRAVAALAGTIGTAGLAGMAAAQTGTAMGLAVLIAGLSTGLASPPLAASVAANLNRHRQDRANTVINAGAAGGVALSAPAAWIFGDDWRFAFMLFAGTAAMATLAIALAMPRAARPDIGAEGGFPSFSLELKRLTASALVMGVASTAVWSFGGELTRKGLGWASGDVGCLWLVIGIFGLTGGLCGAAVQRFGLDRVHVVFLTAMASAILSIAVAANSIIAMAGGAVFGGAYMMLTGVYLVWGVRAVPERPAAGIMIGFLAIAIGQTAGAPLFGFLLEQSGRMMAGVAFALLAVAAAAFPLQRAHPFSATQP